MLSNVCRKRTVFFSDSSCIACVADALNLYKYVRGPAATQATHDSLLQVSSGELRLIARHETIKIKKTKGGKEFGVVLNMQIYFELAVASCSHI